MIKYTIGSITTHVNQWFFPDGCVGVNINVGSRPVDVERFDMVVHINFGGVDEKSGKTFSINDDILALVFTVSALKHQYPLATLHLDMPYVPYARQDRACNPGDSNQLKDTAKLINGLGFATVTVVDPHSIAVEAVYENLHVYDQVKVFSQIKREWNDTYIVAPDQGATKKSEAFAKAVGAAGVITCAKIRDMKSGQILGLRVLDEIPEGANILVLDDICDGGRTFTEVAIALTAKAEIGSLELAVTHGLFTKGVRAVKIHYDNIYTTDSVISDKEGCIVLEI